MALLPYVQLLIASTKWLLYLLFNLVFTLLRNLIWAINGTRSQITANRAQYASSGHMMRVMYGHRLDLFIEARISDFVLVHDSFVPPEYCLRDDVTLLTVTETDAIFVQRRKDSKPSFLYNFTMIGQFETAEKVITMPLESFNRLAESLTIDGKIVFLQNQSRCGGTLFTDFFKFTGRCVTFNEPHVTNAVCKYHYMKGKWDQATAKKMLRNTVRVLCKPYKGLSGTPYAYVIKPTVTSIMCADLVQEAIPEAVQFFIYRDPVSVAISLRRLGQALDTLKLMFYLPNIPLMIAPLFRFIGYCELDFRGWTPKTTQELEFGYRVAAFSMKYYLCYSEKGIKLHGIRYESLRDHSESMATQIFKLSGVPVELVQKAIEALGRDSQAETGFSQNVLNKLIPSPPKPSTKFLEAAREMSETFQVPTPEDWNKPGFLVPGSLQP